MSKHGYQVLGVLTSICAFTSVAGSCYIIYGASLVRGSLKNKSNKTNPVFITEHVLWMSVCDVVQQAWLGFTWLPVGFDGHWNANWSPAACGITGMIAQFFLLASASWNFVIAVSLLRMLNATPLWQFQKEIKYNHIFAWGISFVSCILPWFGSAYGYTKNIELKYGLSEFECWIGVPSYALVLYLPAAIYVFFAALLLLFTYIKSKAKRIQHSSTSWRLALYTIVFVITWTFPIILRIHGMTSSNEPAPFMVWAHHLSIACIGIGNAAIWGTSQSFKEKTSSSKSGRSKDSSKTNTRTKSGKRSNRSQKSIKSDTNLHTADTTVDFDSRSDVISASPGDDEVPNEIAGVIALNSDTAMEEDDHTIEMA
eukprot:167845_1